jgi:hypothetical protein
VIDFNINSAGTIFIDLTSENKPLTGATVVCTVVNPAGLTIVTTQNATDEGEGQYSYELSSTLLNAVGAYNVTWTVTSPINYEQNTTFSVGYEALYQKTLLDVRHMCASMVEGKDGFFLGSVTTPAAGSITDTARVEPDKTHVGGWIYVYAGTAKGQERRITSVTGTTQLNVTPNFSPVPDIGDLYEIHRTFNVTDYNRAINQAQTDIADECLVRITNSSTVLTATKHEYDIPAGFSHIYGAEVQLFEDHWRPISPACWSVVMGLRKLTLQPNICWSYSGCKLRILGLRPPMELFSDATGVDVRPAYLVCKAGSYLAYGKMGGSTETGGWSQKHQFLAAEAVMELQNMNKSIPNNTRRVD